MNVDALAAVRANKSLLALDWAELHRLETFLAGEFGIVKSPDGEDVNERMRLECGDLVANEYRRLNTLRSFGTSEDEAAAKGQFWDLLCQDPLSGITHSQRWPFILDAAAYITALARLVQHDGLIVDVGCHVGYHAMWLANALGCPVRAFDASPSAVTYARERAARLGLTPLQVTFEHGDFPRSRPREPASLMICVDGPIELRASDYVHAASGLAQNGLFIHITAGLDCPQRTIRRTVAAAGLTLELADVIGGWNGYEFNSRMVLVLRRGPEPRVPKDVITNAKSIWETGFADYCNTPERRKDRKTLSFYRTTRTFGAPPSHAA